MTLFKVLKDKIHYFSVSLNMKSVATKKILPPIQLIVSSRLGTQIKDSGGTLKSG